jgi:hypothetical protein
MRRGLFPGSQAGNLHLWGSRHFDDQENCGNWGVGGWGLGFFSAANIWYLLLGMHAPGGVENTQIIRESETQKSNKL